MINGYEPLPEVDLEGPGTDTIAIACHGDRVILTFEHPVKWVAMDSETSYKVAEQIARSAFATIAREDVEGHRSALIEKCRAGFIDSIRHLSKSMVINKEFDTPVGLEKFVSRLADEAERAYL